MKKLIRVLSAMALLVAMGSFTRAAAPPGPYFNGFEHNTNGWFNGVDRAIVREPSTYMNGVGGYANGIQSADGNWHARLPALTSCMQNCDGPFTNWGGYSSMFPPGGYFTQLDIYLDTAWAAMHPDVRFDWISAINDNTGAFLRDFVFNVGTLPTGFIIQTSTNSTRSGANPNVPCPDPKIQPNTCRPPTTISASGWYSFRHTFRDQAGTLAVDFDIFAHGSNTPIAHQTIYADPISIVGGNRYGGFSNEEIPDLAIDNSLRTGVCRQGDGDGEVDDEQSGNMRHVHFHKKSSCENPNDTQDDNVQSFDENSGSHFESNAFTSSTYSFDENSETITILGTGSHDGLPVGFTMVAVDNSNLVPAVFTLILTDGYIITGNVTNGTVVLQ